MAPRSARGRWPRPGEAGGIGRVFAGILAVLVILALGGLVVYLLSDINSRRYRLNSVAGELVVEKGRFFPVGFERFTPRAKALAEAYAPVPMPEGEYLGQPEVYEDRADLDRALFSLLAGWARNGLQANNAEALGQAAKYIDRCDLLPGLSEQQRQDLRTLRADLAYKHARHLVWRMEEMLHEALAEFRLAKELGTSRPTDADLWIKELESRVGGRDKMRRSPAELLPEIPMPNSLLPPPEEEQKVRGVEEPAEAPLDEAPVAEDALPEDAPPEDSSPQEAHKGTSRAPPDPKPRPKPKPKPKPKEPAPQGRTASPPDAAVPEAGH